MNNENKICLIAEILEMDESSLMPEMELDSLDSWDSMAKLSLITMVEDECYKILKGDIIKEFKTIKDIMDYME